MSELVAAVINVPETGENPHRRNSASKKIITSLYPPFQILVNDIA